MLPRGRRVFISSLIVIWALVFNYEALRWPYLQPVLNKRLPDIPILYSALGWNMFYKMDNQWMAAEYHGLKDDLPPEQIDPHLIFDTKVFGYDPVKLNLPTPSVFDPKLKASFCRFVNRKLPDYDAVVVSLSGYKQLTPERSEKIYYPNAYQCPQT